MSKEMFKRVRFVACAEGNEDMLAERTGILIHGGERKYSRAGFDCFVMLDESGEPEDEYARQYFPAFEECWFPFIERWPVEKWSGRLLVEADSATHLAIIGFAEIDVEAGIVIQQPASADPLINIGAII